MKAVYVYSNYNLNEHKQSAGDSFSAFKVPDSAGEQAEVAAEQDPHARYTLRRGNLIFKDVTEDGSDKDESDGEEADGEDGKQERERVRTERRELHPAVGSERCASQSPMVSLSPQSLRHSMTAWLTALSTEDVRLADGQDHRDGHERHASPRQEVQLPHCMCGPTAAKGTGQASCKSTTMAMGHTLATTRGSS